MFSIICGEFGYTFQNLARPFSVDVAYPADYRMHDGAMASGRRPSELVDLIGFMFFRPS